MSHPLHVKAVELSSRILSTEKELVLVLQEIEKERVYRLLGFNSLFQYCVLALKLSESQSYALISVSRKCSVTPVLQEAVLGGEVSVSKAHRIVSVVNSTNASLWIEKAKELTNRKLEEEVVKVSPRVAVRESIRPVTHSLSQLTVCLDKESESLFAKAREVLSKNLKKPLSLEETIKELSQFYLSKKDPLKKAERVLLRPKRLCTGRVPKRPSSDGIPALIKHQVILRDKGQCQALLPNKTKCHSTYFPDLHHIKHRSLGGTHTLENLITLCKPHHQQVHHNQTKRYGFLKSGGSGSSHLIPR